MWARLPAWTCEHTRSHLWWFATWRLVCGRLALFPWGQQITLADDLCPLSAQKPCSQLDASGNIGGGLWISLKGSIELSCSSTKVFMPFPPCPASSLRRQALLWDIYKVEFYTHDVLQGGLREEMPQCFISLTFPPSQHPHSFAETCPLCPDAALDLRDSFGWGRKS